MPTLPFNQIVLARQAMATRFEIILYGKDPVALRAAGEEALDEVERLDHQLSPYRSTSEVCSLNARAAREPVRVSPALFQLLKHAKQLTAETAGAFDITIAPLMECWGLRGQSSGRIPKPKELAQARAKVGMHLVQLDPKNFSVRFAREGVMLDFGAIGKGYAIERAANLLREAGITSAMLHGGTSTVYALGTPPDAEAWNVAVENPLTVPAQFPTLLAVVPLKDEALSISAVWGKSFQAGRKTYGHVLDPRTGQPTSHALLSAVVAASATESDALSTALLTVGAKGHAAISALRPQMRTLLLEPTKGKTPFRIHSHGIDIRNATSSASKAAPQVQNRVKSPLKKQP